MRERKGICQVRERFLTSRPSTAFRLGLAPSPIKTSRSLRRLAGLIGERGLGAWGRGQEAVVKAWVSRSFPQFII